MPTLQDNLMELEKRYWEGFQRKDGKVTSQLSADTCLVVGEQGASQVRRAEMAGMTTSPRTELKEFKIDQRSIQFMPITDDVAVVAYRVEEKMVTNGKPQTAEFCDSTVWVRDGNEWRAAVHSETPVAAGAR
jgi:hypothetical protein